MKLKLILTIISLLMISMLLINVVLLLLWKHDALQREVKYDQAILSHIHSLLLQDKQGRAGKLEHQFVFSEYYDASEQGRFFFLLHAGNGAGQGEDTTSRTTGISVSEESKITALLAGVARKAQHTGKPVSRTASVNPHALLCNDLLLNAQPVVDQEEIIGAVAVVRSLEPLFLTLWQHEKTLLVYLVLNVLILGVIGFFRMTRLIIRPVDHLVALADQYRNYDPFQFTPENSGSEFGKLSKSLNSMLARIEDDRQSLQQTVTALEAANLTLKKQQQEMVRTEKLATVGRMAAGLAHEIGNPLSVVQGYVEM
ncbi:MAG: sensor histidine kinase, partial [Candidatus Electrothrix sp. MAN1_4]|nr:sensor histidine kinase [Candidatus Electrothrix sp. MAN1_4]